MFRKCAMISFVALGVAACDTTGYWGANTEEILPGERISVLQFDRGIEADPDLFDAEILLPPPTPNPEWSQAGGTANNAMHHIAINDSIDRVWRVDIGSGSDDEERIVAQPIIAGGRIFALDAENTLSAYDAASGDDLWDVDLTPEDEEDGHVSGGMAYENGRLYVATGFAELMALDPASGQEIWRKRMGAPMRTAPTARGNRVFVITVDNKMFAVDGRNGDDLWRNEGLGEVAGILGGANPAVDTGVVVVPFASGDLVALRVVDGQIQWEDSLTTRRRVDSLSSIAALRGLPVIDRGLVIASSNSGITKAIDLSSGRTVWEQEIGSLNTPWVAGDYVFVITTDGQVVCLGRADGRIYWVTQLPLWEDPEDREGRIHWSGPVLVSDRLVITSSTEEAWAISPYTGNILGVEELPSEVRVPPLTANGMLYFLSEDADLIAYR